MKKLPAYPSFKGLYYFSFSLLLSIILCACPFRSAFKLDDEALLPVDEQLLGKWATMIQNGRGQSQPVKLILTKRNDNEYNVDVTGDLRDLWRFRVVKDDTIKGAAFASTVLNHQFLNVEVLGQTYITEIIYQNDTLSLLPLEDGFTSKYIKSNAALRTAVEVHVNTRLIPRFDEQFSLKQMVRVN
jgi:hypothetical protein